MLDLVRRGWLSRHFLVVDGSATVGELRMSRFRDEAQIQIGGRGLRARRTEWFGRAFALESDGLVLAKATRPSLLSPSLAVEADGQRYMLTPRWSLERATTVFQLLSDAVVQGVVLFGESFFRRSLPARGVVELPNEMSLETRLFVAWLALYTRRGMVD
jgi:hypothetical protein